MKNKIGFLSAKELDKLMEALFKISGMSIEIEDAEYYLKHTGLWQPEESNKSVRNYINGSNRNLNSILHYHSLIPEDGSKVGRLNKDQLILMEKAKSFLSTIPELMNDAMRAFLNGDINKAISFIDIAEKKRKEAERAVKKVDFIHDRVLWETVGRTAYKVSRNLLEMGVIGFEEYNTFVEKYLNS